MQTCQDNNNFNEELMQLLCQDDDDDDENICLITNTKLKNNFVKLVCGHKFNYKSIFNEVKNQKKYWNHYETQKLKENEIKCPYCRTIQTGLLPHYGNYAKINGINWPRCKQFKPNKCAYIFSSGKRKGLPCNKGCFEKYCLNHEKIIEKRELKNSLNKKKKVMEDFNNSPLSNFIIEAAQKEYHNTCAYVFKRGKNIAMPKPSSIPAIIARKKPMSILVPKY